MIDHEKNLRKAIELSKQSIDSGSSPFGCVIVDAEGKIVGEGHNRVAPDNDPTAHGEIVAIRNATRNAGDMISRLTLRYNRMRQTAITTELVEIIAGAEAI